MTNVLGIRFSPEYHKTGVGEIHLSNLHAKAQDWYGRYTPFCNLSKICNTVFFPILWYAVQAVPCKTFDVQRVNRFCAVYIWESKFERMRRSNLFLCRDKGSRRVVNVELKPQVQRFLFFS